MDQLEELLSQLPQAKLGRSADWRLLLSLRLKMLQKKLAAGLSGARMKRFSMAGVYALVLVLVFGSTSIFAYASESILPGDQLYPLKLAVEEVEKQIAITPKAKIKVRQKISERRMKEAVLMSRSIAQNTKP